MSIHIHMYIHMETLFNMCTLTKNLFVSEKLNVKSTKIILQLTYRRSLHEGIGWRNIDVNVAILLDALVTWSHSIKEFRIEKFVVSIL